MILSPKIIVKKRYCCFLILLFLFSIAASALAEDTEKGSLSVTMPWQGRVVLEGDIAQGDRIRLYQRVYKTAEHVIKDQLILDTEAETASPVTLNYGWYGELPTEAEYKPDFPKPERYVELTAVYVVVSNKTSTIHSDLIYTYCWMDTGVVNQYWCSVAANTACGPAAGAIAMQFAYPAEGNDLFTRVNDMRKYSLLGEDFVCDSGWYDTAGKHITNAVNKYITEELDGKEEMVDFRTPDKSTEDTLLELITSGRPPVIEVCYIRGGITLEFYGYSHWITLNGFILRDNGYNFFYSDPLAVNYREISSEWLEKSNQNVQYPNPDYIDRYIGAMSEPLFSIEDYPFQS